MEQLQRLQGIPKFTPDTISTWQMNFMSQMRLLSCDQILLDKELEPTAPNPLPANTFQRRSTEYQQQLTEYN
jgi:hypothetical protein